MIFLVDTYKLYSNQKKGNFTLHITCCNPHMNLKKLLDLYPDAANIPNKKGLYPLHLALRWCEGYGRRRRCTVSWNYGLGSVFAAAKHVVTKCDPDTYLYPFMTAAISKNEEQRYETDCNKKEGHCCLTTICILLRQSLIKQPLPFPLHCAYVSPYQSYLPQRCGWHLVSMTIGASCHQ